MKNRTRYHKTVLLILCALMLTVLTNETSAQNRKTGSQRTQAKIQKARVEIGKMGYQPATLTLKRGLRAEITFLRKTDQTCATEVVFADYGVHRDLPLNRAVVVSFTPTKAGAFNFTCGMNMHRGKLIVR